MTTRTERVLCLALTVLGPIATHTPSRKASSPRHPSKPLRELLDSHIHSLFHSIELGVLKTLSCIFSKTEHCLQTLGLEFSESSSTREEIQTLGISDEDAQKLNKDVIHLSRALEVSRNRCEELTDEVHLLRNQCTSYSEAASILEQDREQLESLLSDKCKLIEENQNLERRIRSLSELLHYATAERNEVRLELENPLGFCGDEVSINEEVLTEDGTVIESSPHSQDAFCGSGFD